MVLHDQINLPASCGSVQDLTNPDFCGTGVFASYTVGVALVFVHQASFAIMGCISKRRANLETRNSELGVSDPADIQQSYASDTERWQLKPSLEASSISLFDTAIVLAISWQVAALLSLNSASSVQTTHDILLVCLTSYAAIAISLGALCTSFDHIRRHKYRLIFSVVATILCAAVTGVAYQAILKDDYPKEICLPFFNDYKQNMRRYFVVLSVVFWIISLIMVLTMCLSLRSTRLTTMRERFNQSHPRTLRCLSKSRLYIVVIVELVLLVMIIFVNHFYVPEQVLRAQAGGQLAESQWTFGQIVGMLIWLPVLVEFGYVFLFGPKEGLEGRLPVHYFVNSQAVGSSTTQMPLTRIGSALGNVSKTGTRHSYVVI